MGRLTYEADSPATTRDTCFDLASLTKVIAATSVAMHLIRRERLSLDTAVADVFEEWRTDARRQITVGHLLDHSSGLPATVALDARADSRQGARAALLGVPLDRPVGSASVYSDVGFMILGFLLEAAGGQTLDVQWNALWSSRPDTKPPAQWLSYQPGPGSCGTIAPTEIDPTTGVALQGIVHDENARRLGGVAAHAGLFSRAEAVGAFAAWVLRSFRQPTWLATPDLMHLFAARRAVPASSRALGWDTMLPTSSCGSRMSPTAIGHTGFTGTSLWIDWERDLYFVLLTNRVHPTRTNETFLPYRARFHDQVIEDLS